MKNSFKLFLAAAAFVGFAANANAQAQDNASATAYARIISPINIENVDGSDLSFGSMVSSASGTVTVDPQDGSRSASGVITVNQGTPSSAAAFTVTGEPEFEFNISFPNSAVITNGDDDLTVDGFTSSIGLSGTLSTGGTASFNVGGTLHLGGGESTGVYTGGFNVQVAYN